MTDKELTRLQATVLFVVDNNSPASATDVAYHLHTERSTARHRLYTLERLGLIDRQYTGHNRGGASYAYVLTDAGAEALERSDAGVDEEVR